MKPSRWREIPSSEPARPLFFCSHLSGLNLRRCSYEFRTRVFSRLALGVCSFFVTGGTGTNTDTPWEPPKRLLCEDGKKNFRSILQHGTGAHTDWHEKEEFINTERRNPQTADDYLLKKPVWWPGGRRAVLSHPKRRSLSLPPPSLPLSVFFLSDHLPVLQESAPSDFTNDKPQTDVRIAACRRIT